MSRGTPPWPNGHRQYPWPLCGQTNHAHHVCPPSVPEADPEEETEALIWAEQQERSL